MINKNYKFTDYDLKFRKRIEKQRGGKLSDEEFYKFIQKQKKWLRKFIKVVKKWVEEKSYEAEQLSRLVKSWEEKKKNKELYDKLAKIKKLSVTKLQKLLVAALKKEGYINLELYKPEIKKDMIIEFTVQDNKTGRGEYDSRIQLQRIIKKTLENTNWRLMSEGVNYRLGILSGRLRGYENEEDFIKLIRA
jgi:predicted Zn-ribbon and HTH transcriptional regulator